MLHIAGLEHEDADFCVWFSDVKADVSFTSAEASSNETGLLPEESFVSFALMMSSVRSETSFKPVPKTQITSSDWRKIGSMDPALEIGLRPGCAATADS